jgi:phosphoribosylaminoimidazole-succinocarboxamide synthase
MAQIVKAPVALSEPETRAALFAQFTNPKRRHSGKSRDSFRFWERNYGYLRLVYTSDRRSIFDMRLGFPVDDIGVVLNAWNLFWRFEMDKAGFLHDLVAWGQDIDRFLPEELRGNPELWKRAIVVRELDISKFEHIVRFRLTGTGWETYKEFRGLVCGQQLPAGYYNGQLLPEPLYTPSTKAKVGHDELVDINRVRRLYRGAPAACIKLATFLKERLERTTYFRLVDWKGEGEIDGTGNIIWGDAITPDEMRIWRESDIALLPGKLPPGFDKEPLRNWGRTLGIDKLQPEDEADQARAREFVAPEEVRYHLRMRYLQVFEAVAHRTVVDFGETKLGIPPARRVL